MNKRTWMAVGVFAVLLSFVLLTREKKVEVGIQKLEIPKFNILEVVSVDISGAGKIFLKKEAEGWRVRDAKRENVFHPADEAAVTTFLNALQSFKTDALVTDNSARHAELEVDDAKGARVKVYTAKGLVTDLVLGKSSQFGGVYVRDAQKPFVFTSSTSLGWDAKKDVNGWRLRQMAQIKADDVQGLSVRHSDGTSIQLRKEGAAWQLPPDFKTPQGFRFDASVGERIVHQLAGLSAQEFLDEAGAPQLWGLDPAQVVLEATLKDGKNLKLSIGNSFPAAETKLAGQLNQQFAKFDANSDGKIVQDEVVKAETDAAQEVRDVAAGLKQGNLFARIDLGGRLGATGDGAISKEEVASMQRIGSLVPVKVNDEAQIFLIAATTSENLSLRLDSLRDLSLASIPVEEVEKLELAFKNTKVILAKDGANWKVLEPKKLPEGFELGTNQVASQINMLRSLKANRWVEGIPDAQAGLARPTLTVALVRKDGASQKILFGNEFSGQQGGKDVYVRGAMDKFIYALPAYSRSRLEQGLELFRKRPPPSMNQISGMENLPPDVRARLEAQLRQQFAQ